MAINGRNAHDSDLDGYAGTLAIAFEGRLGHNVCLPRRDTLLRSVSCQRLFLGYARREKGALETLTGSPHCSHRMLLIRNGSAVGTGDSFG